jgi:NAD(P)-dependent dehydrogenase (short-subunit alcohol dehydrogenase family)
MDLHLDGRVAVVTGASQGIGRAITLALAAEGADVVVVARRRDGLEAVAQEIAALGRRAEVVAADVTDHAAAGQVAATALDAFGRIDILVNNAGKGAPKPLLELTPPEWEAVLELNLLSAVRLVHACAPTMRARRWGRIVNIASRVALEPDPYFAAYAAAKAALVNFSKSCAGAFASDGVLTNCVVPGLIRSEAVDEAARRSAEATGRTVDEVLDATLRKRPIPVGRLGEPDDVAGLVVLLASERASWITGGCFVVDGGIVRGDR